jgi:serine protease Do
VGTFGAGLFTSYDSDLDFTKREWRAYPGGRPNFDGMERLKSRFTDPRGGERIIADATVDGYTGDFLLDTGAPGELLLFGRATSKSGLWDANRPYAPQYGSGIGRNRVPGRLVRAKQLKIGSFVFENPLVRLSEPGTPSGRMDGIIGLKTLERLNLSTQASRKVVWAARSNAPVPRGGYPLSGLWLDDDGGRVTIADVGTGSPAAAAGLKKGDVAVGALGPLIAATNGPPGKQVKLTIERGGVRQDVGYTLAPWF